MRLAIITKTQLKIYEGKVLLAVYEIEGPIDAAAVEEARTYNYDSRA